jgi:hypothetical protein
MTKVGLERPFVDEVSEASGCEIISVHRPLVVIDDALGKRRASFASVLHDQCRAAEISCCVLA